MPVAAAMDVVDEAAWLPEQERTEAVRRVRAPLKLAGADACAGCGDEIEPARRAALPSARRCLPCQERVERRDAGYARPAIVEGSGTTNFRGKVA